MGDSNFYNPLVADNYWFMDSKGQMTQVPFDIISSSEILTQEDIIGLDELRDELKETFLKVQKFRTRTEMEISVLNDVKFPTPAAKYWQAVREQSVMFHELVMLSYEYRKNLIEIKKFKRKLKKERDDLEKELIGIEIERSNFIARNQESTAKARIIEIKEWSDIKVREATKMSESELADVGNHQLVSYTKRFINQKLIVGDIGSVAEKQNLAGQLMTSLRECQKRNLLDGVMEGFNEEIRGKILGQVKLLKYG